MAICYPCIPSTSDEKYAANAYEVASKSDMAMQLGCIAVRSGKLLLADITITEHFQKMV